nr:UTP--glucose-1-phosphate uridylyltransferase-like [Tanacetum cinerariifolium]
MLLFKRYLKKHLHFKITDGLLGLLMFYAYMLTRSSFVLSKLLMLIYVVIAEGRVVNEAAKLDESTRPRFLETFKLDGTNDELKVVQYEDLMPVSDDYSRTKEILDKLVVVKMNDKEGTNMGFDGPKSAIEISNGFTSLDLLANYIESLNTKYGCNVSLLLMNDASTHDETLKIMEKRSNKSITCVVKDPLLENDWNEDPLLEDNRNAALLSLKESGKLDDLLSQGKEYILVLNSDNFTEAVDPNILNHLIKNKIKYCMELEEKSWTPATLNSRPIAVTVPVSHNVLLEETSDLLILKSDLYICDQGILVRNEARINPSNPTIKLGPEFEKITDFESRFKSIPSIIDLENLKVTGDVWFGSDVSVKGIVIINARPGEKIVIPDGAVLENKQINDQKDVQEVESFIRTDPLSHMSFSTSTTGQQL